MKKNKFGEIIFSEDDIVNTVMKGHDLSTMKNMLVETGVDLETAALILEDVPSFIQYDQYAEENLSIQEFDHRNQEYWFMPEEYKQLDIAKHILDLCKTETELQRVGH